MSDSRAHLTMQLTFEKVGCLVVCHVFCMMCLGMPPGDTLQHSSSAIHCNTLQHTATQHPTFEKVGCLVIGSAEPFV